MRVLGRGVELSVECLVSRIVYEMTFLYVKVEGYLTHKKTPPGRTLQ